MLNTLEKIDLIYKIGIIHTLFQFLGLLILLPLEFILINMLYFEFEILLSYFLIATFLNFLLIPFLYINIHNYFIKRFKLISLLDKLIEFLIISFISSFLSMLLLFVLKILFPNFKLIKDLKVNQNLDFVFKFTFSMFVITFISEFIRFEFFDNKGLE